MIRWIGCIIMTFLLALPHARASVKDEGITVVPRPALCEKGKGVFVLLPSTRVVVISTAPRSPFAAAYFAQQMRTVSGFPLEVRSTARLPKDNYVSFEYVADAHDRQRDHIGSEGYVLDVTSSGVRIRATSDAGHFYAVQTLLQLLPEASFGTAPVSNVRWSIPCVHIQDTPRFAWRGMHLDVSRHFFPKEFIKTYIDMLAMYKLNTFHWHLTDDQGWRIEIRKYPRLTEVGAWRADRSNVPWDLRQPQREGEAATYGGFYAQEDVREIVRYAEERNITVIPEIEMPAHTTAALAAYPEYSCTGGPFRVTTGALWPITDIFCAGNDSTFAFLQDVLSEICELFPGTFIHVGGDEADKTNWKTCPKCQARMRQEGLANENALQSYFITRIEKFLLSKNRRLVGWDEILEGGLAPQATVMSWRGMDGGHEAARMGHDVVMTPGSHCYLSQYQGRPEFEPPAGGGYLPLRKVYAFEPVPEGLTPGEAAHILGGQGCLWSEFVADGKHAEYMLLPRLAALAEVLWTPAQLRNEDHFFARMESQLSRYRAAGLRYATSLYSVSMSTELDTVRGEVLVSLANESGNTPIHYTLDGSDPTPTSTSYRMPFTVGKSVEIRAVSVRNGTTLGPPTQHRVFVHKAVARRVTVRQPYLKYDGGGAFALVNGVCGTMSYDDGTWQGYEKSDVDAIVDLGAVTTIGGITTHFLRDHHAWIFAPTQILLEVSEDGRSFTTVGSWELPVPAAAQQNDILEFGTPVSGVKGRYVRVFAKNPGVCPEWHIGRGGSPWLFVDEIIVE